MKNPTKKYIALFPGCFDPFHHGHLNSLKTLIKTNEISQILLIPTTQPPHKKKPLISKKKRLSIIKTYLTKNNLSQKIKISLIEYHKETSYTYQTILHFKEKFKKNIALILGTDALTNLHSYKNVNTIIQNSFFFIIKRNISSTKKIQTIINTHFKENKKKFHILDNPITALSSTEIKHHLYHQKAPLNWLKKNNIDLDLPLIIGITGSIGSGKSTAATAIKQHNNVSIIDLDKIGHKCLKLEEIKNKIIKNFGKKIMTLKKNISRKKLAKIVFANKKKLEILNQIVHPEIKKKAFQQIINSNRPCLICGALIDKIQLIEICHEIITITAPNTLIKKHIGNKINRTQFQASKQTYLNQANKVISNNFTSEFQENCIKTYTEIKKKHIYSSPNKSKIVK